MNRRSFLFLLTLVFAGCSPKDSTLESEDLTVSAAVSLKDAFIEIGEIYKTKTGRNVSFNFGASGALQKQIETGAPVDVFASAGEKQMDDLAKRNIAIFERHDFARNKLVLIVPANAKSTLTDFSKLSDSEIKKIAVGNPKTVPAGQYTSQVFEKLNLQNDLQSKLVFAEDVRQVLDYVVRGEVDAGVVYASDVKIAGEKVRVAATAAETLHDPILYPIVVINTKQMSAGKEFIGLVLSAEGQQILQKYGFSSL